MGGSFTGSAVVILLHPQTLQIMSKRSNPALNLAPFGRWTLRDKAAQRRLALLQGLPQIFNRRRVFILSPFPYLI